MSKVLTLVKYRGSKRDVEVLLRFWLDSNLIRSWYYNGVYHVIGNNGNLLTIELI